MADQEEKADVEMRDAENAAGDDAPAEGEDDFERAVIEEAGAADDGDEADATGPEFVDDDEAAEEEAEAEGGGKKDEVRQLTRFFCLIA